MSRYLFTSFFLVLSILVILGVANRTIGNNSDRYKDPATDSQKRPAITVSLATPHLEEWPLHKEAGGSIEARQETIVSSRLSGVPVVSILSRIGDKVKKGQVLAELDKDEITYNLEQSRAALDEAQAIFDDAYKNAKRAEVIQDDSVLSASEVSQYRTNSRVAQARLKNARVQYALQKLRLKHTQIIANEDGTIVSASIHLGEVPSVGNVLFHIVGKDLYEWRAEMTVDELNMLPDNTVVVFGDSENDNGFMTGRLKSVSPQIDDKLRNGIAFVDIDNKTPSLKKGMYLRGRFVLGSRYSLSILKSALVLKDGYSLVYHIVKVNNGVGRVDARRVRIGGERGDYYEVLEGLSESDTYVVSGGGLIDEGDLVRVSP